MTGLLLIASGRVQGVGYRYAANKEAGRNGLSGWVKNLPDGSVEMYAEGPENKVEAFAKWAAQGPPGGRVTSLKKQYKSYTGYYSGFRIDY